MQEQMYQDVKAWLTSGMKKKDFLSIKIKSPPSMDESYAWDLILYQVVLL